MYYAIIHWYNEKDNLETSYLIVLASSYSEALVHVEAAFDDISDVMIDQLESTEQHIVYLPETVASAVKNENIF